MSYFDMACLWIGRLIVGCAGIAATTWITATIMNFAHRQMGISMTFIEFLYWKHDKRKKRRGE